MGWKRQQPFRPSKFIVKIDMVIEVKEKRFDYDEKKEIPEGQMDKYIFKAGEVWKWEYRGNWYFLQGDSSQKLDEVIIKHANFEQIKRKVKTLIEKIPNFKRSKKRRISKSMTYHMGFADKEIPIKEWIAPGVLLIIASDIHKKLFKEEH